MTSALEALAAALADRYRVERELGRGGRATVYLARDLKHDRAVALKVLKPRHYDIFRTSLTNPDPEYAHLIDEARAALEAAAGR